MKKRSLVICALAAVLIAGVLSGCGSTYYFAGRSLPPSKLVNRVLVAIQNPSTSSKGLLQIMDAFYDIRHSYDDKIPSFVISGFNGALPVTIQNMPEEQVGAVYGSGDGSFTLINYAKETTGGAAASLGTTSASIFITRNSSFVFAANQQATVFTVVDSAAGRSYSLGLPGVYRVSTNPGGSMALAFVQNSNYMYYPRKLQSSESISLAAYYVTNHAWPKPYIDCEPQNLPGMCLAQAQDPNGNALVFDRPVKAVFSADGSNAIILNCGPECGGTASSISVVPIAPMLIQSGQQTGTLPTTPPTYPVPGGASNALVNSNTLYVMGQQYVPASGLFTGNLTIVDLSSGTPIPGSPISISDGAPGQRTRMILADDNTLWLGSTRCTEGERYATGQAYGCLTMFNTSTKSVTLIEPYQGDLTGIAAVTGLHKIYIAEGGQVYIYSTTDGSAINNFFVTVTGTAYDVAYMDALTDGDNTVY